MKVSNQGINKPARTAKSNSQTGQSKRGNSSPRTEFPPKTNPS